MLCNSDNNSSSSTYEFQWDEGKGCTLEERNITVESEYRFKDYKNQ